MDEEELSEQAEHDLEWLMEMWTMTRQEVLEKSVRIAADLAEQELFEYDE